MRNKYRKVNCQASFKLVFKVSPISASLPLILREGLTLKKKMNEEEGNSKEEINDEDEGDE